MRPKSFGHATGHEGDGRENVVEEHDMYCLPVGMSILKDAIVALFQFWRFPGPRCEDCQDAQLGFGGELMVRHSIKIQGDHEKPPPATHT